MTTERIRDILTPDQAADYLQVDRETVYRYIRDGKLAASRLGRAYRIPKRSLDLLLWATRTRKDLSLREYTGEQIAEFIQADALDEEAHNVARRFRQATDREEAKRSEELKQKRFRP
jgi:excisionase family DNA binding protein